MQDPKPSYWPCPSATASRRHRKSRAAMHSGSLALFHDSDAQVSIPTAPGWALNSIAYIMCLKSWYSESCIRRSAFMSPA